MTNKEKTYFTAITQVLRTGHRLTDQVTQVLKPFDISEPQYNVLRILRGQKGKAIAVQEIRERMIQRSSNVTRIVDKLKKKGLVDRRSCEENRRKMDISITSRGLALLKEMDPYVEQLHQPYLEKLNQSEAELLIKLLHKLS